MMCAEAIYGLHRPIKQEFSFRASDDDSAHEMREAVCAADRIPLGFEHAAGGNERAALVAGQTATRKNQLDFGSAASCLPRTACISGSELDTAAAFNILLSLPQATVPGRRDAWNDDIRKRRWSGHGSHLDHSGSIPN